MVLIIKINDIVGASLDTSLTPRAFGIIHNDDAVRSFDDGVIGANICAGWVITMTAHVYPKNEIQGVIDHTRSVFGNINEFDAIEGAIFLLAGHFTGFTSPTSFMIDDEQVLFHTPPAAFVSG